MKTGEVPSSSPEEEMRRAYNFCEDIRHAVELTDIANKLEAKVHDAVSRVTQKSMFDNPSFRLKVSIPSEVEAYVTVDDKVVESEPELFDATEIRTIDKHGVEFYNRETNKWLRIRGYDFEVRPIFIDPVELQPQGDTDISADKETLPIGFMGEDEYIDPKQDPHSS